MRELTDEQVLEVQLVENLKREALHELEEAEGYEEQLKNHARDLIHEWPSANTRISCARRALLCAFVKHGAYFMHKGF